MPHVTALTTVLNPSLGWHCARLTFMVRFIGSVLTLRTTDLWGIAASLKASVQTASNYRRIRRFLAEYDVGYAAQSTLLVRLVPQEPPYQEPPYQEPPYQEPPYMLVLDRTEWHFGATPVNVLMIGMRTEASRFRWRGPLR